MTDARPHSGPLDGFQDLRELADEIEAHLREIDFDEVTIEDRVTYVEHAVAWRMQLAFRRGRPDLAAQLERHGRRRIAELECGHEPARGASGLTGSAPPPR